VTAEIDPKDLDWWRSKIVRGAQNNRHGTPRGFGPIAARHALRVLEQLVGTSSPHSFAAPTLSAFATLIGLRTKFVPRAVAMLARSGLVRVQLVPSPAVTLLPDRFPRRKNAAQSTPRRHLSRDERVAVFRRDRFRCGHCTERFPPSNLEVDHIVPVCLLGADSQANWITLCREHNRSAWDGFDPAALRFYRGRRVLRATGVRFRRGFFWPVVNGRVCLDRMPS
jgi:hypothetical protein